MATVVAIRFPWGRYHATPWGHSVSEGIVEWPPSPWRLLRALYCTWRFRARHLPERDVLRLLSLLADPPSYALPPYIEGHTRHYMPDNKFGSDKVFDPFVVTQRGAELFVRWDVDLDASSSDALAQLVERLPYLGRADSVCEARLVDTAQADCRWTEPDLAEPARASGTIRLLGATQPLDHSALTMSTMQVRHVGRVTPPGTRWVSYGTEPSSPVPPSARRTRRRAPQTVRFAVDGPALPSLEVSVAVCDLLRRAAMSALGSPSATFAGKDADGVPLRGHAHAHYLALDVDTDRLIDHLVVWAPRGISERELLSLTGLRRLSTRQSVDGFHPVRLAVEAVGGPAAVVPELVGPARDWTSLTPFAPPRHQARRQTFEEFIRGEIRRELANRDLPPADVVPIVADWPAFRRRRLSERVGTDRHAVGLRLEFTQTISGPICLGALSHFGLGVFFPA